MKVLNINKSFFALTLSIFFLSGCSSIKPKLSGNQKLLTAKWLAVTDICVDHGLVNKSMGDRFKRYKIGSINNYQYDSSELSDQYNHELKGMNKEMLTKDINIETYCNELTSSTLTVDKQRIQQQRDQLAAQQAMAAFNSVAGVIGRTSQDAANNINAMTRSMPTYDYNLQSPISNNTQNYLINTNKGLVRKTCTGSGSLRYCF